MGNDLGKGIDKILKRKKFLGLLFLAIGVILFITGNEISFDPSSLGFIAFIFVIVGIIIVSFQLIHRRKGHV